MDSTHPYDLVIGLDRSDRKADLYSIHTLSDKTEKQIISTSPGKSARLAGAIAPGTSRGPCRHLSGATGRQPHPLPGGLLLDHPLRDQQGEP